MLNYLWAGLLIVSFGFAIGQDLRDALTDAYGNGRPRIVELSGAPPPQGGAVRFTLPGGNGVHEGSWSSVGDRRELVVGGTAELPEPWRRVAEHAADEDGTLRARVIEGPDEAGRLRVLLPQVQLPRLRAMTEAAFEMAEFAVTLAIGLAGLMALWLGLMAVAERAGLIALLVRAVRPLLGRLFPDVPPDHPALGSISLNLAANVLGMGNAATPMGIRAMQQLQELNPRKDTATDAMCMFLALNTSSVQLVPPVTLVALMGVGVGELIFSILLATLVSTIVAVVAARGYARRRRTEDA